MNVSGLLLAQLMLLLLVIPLPVVAKLNPFLMAPTTATEAEHLLMFVLPTLFLLLVPILEQLLPLLYNLVIGIDNALLLPRTLRALLVVFVATYVYLLPQCLLVQLYLPLIPKFACTCLLVNKIVEIPIRFPIAVDYMTMALVGSIIVLPSIYYTALNNAVLPLLFLLIIHALEQLYVPATLLNVVGAEDSTRLLLQVPRLL